MLSLLIFLLFSQNILYSSAQKGFKFKYTNFICDPNPEWLINVTCGIKAINWKLNAIYIDAYAVKPLIKIKSHIQIFKRYSGYRPFLFNFTGDLCVFFSGVYKNPILRAVGPMMKKFTNLNHKCPMEGHLYGRNITGDLFDFKSIWPDGDYRFDIHTFAGNLINKIIYLTIFFHVSED